MYEKHTMFDPLTLEFLASSAGSSHQVIKMSVPDDPNCAFFKAMDIEDKVQGRTKLKMDGDFKDVIVERVENGHRVTLIPFAGAIESEFKHLIGAKVYADDHVETLGDMGEMYDDIGSST